MIKYENFMFSEVISTEYIMINRQNREKVNSFILEHWFSTDMIIRGAIIDMTKVEGIIVLKNSDIIGLLTYTICGNVCEITSFNSLIEGKGVGTFLINKVIGIAKERGCHKIIVVTTNDNIDAIRFYQRRGFDMARLYHNSLDVSRKIKPAIPLVSNNGISLKHEIEFEINFAK